jgi:putative endonuclease
VDYQARLESVCSRKVTVGSNPTLSAIESSISMWYVYVLKSAVDKKLYIGSTEDISRCLNEHNSGQMEATKEKTPLILETYVAIKTKAKAARLEEYFRTTTGRAILKNRIL